ncbi:MAG TPA: hypothetical protein VEN81_09790 [Planctomycetota bacterium]|nr:hypothetical protein [Planctomycetota bacterium]
MGEDLTFRELLVSVWNQILLKVEHGKPSSQDLVTIGFLLRRVYAVAQAYKAKKTQYTIADWTTKVIEVAQQAGIPV